MTELGTIFPRYCPEPKSKVSGTNGRIEKRAEWLAPMELGPRQATGPAASGLHTWASDKGFLPRPRADYLELLDWTGRQVAPGKRGYRKPPASHQAYAASAANMASTARS